MYYIKCSKCKKNLFCNGKRWESLKTKYPDSKEIVEGKDTILIVADYVCMKCREPKNKNKIKVEIIEPLD